MRSHWDRRHRQGSLVGGVFLLLIGTVFLLHNVGVLPVDMFRTWWPLILIFIGLAKLSCGSWVDRPQKPYDDFGPIQN